MTDHVRHTEELDRILALPRRDVNADPAFTAYLVEELTSIFSTPPGTCKGCELCGFTGTMRLRPIQAHALHDFGTRRGGFFPIGVGEGKTLITLLAPAMVDAKNPMLLLPAGLIDKTIRDREKLTPHWDMPKNLRLFSYEMLGLVQSACELDTYGPDVVLADEVQGFKNADASRTRRMLRRMASHPDTIFGGFSGTIMDRSVLEFAHILFWSLKGDSPIPIDENELSDWSFAIDEKVEERRRYRPGALEKLVAPEDKDLPELTRIRRGFQRRLVETPGVVASTGSGERVNCSIRVNAITYPMKPITDQHFARLRAELKTPDEDWDVEPVDVWRHARELALGFHMIWDPRPPEEWRNARSAWFSYVRRVLSRSHTIDSPHQAELAILDGTLRGEGAELLARWGEIEPTFIPNPVPVWHDDSAIKVAAKWMRKKGPAGIVWTSHRPFATRLAEVTGAPYFGQKGRSEDGTFIEDAPEGTTIIASIDACSEGLNLQFKWSRLLYTAIEESPTLLQQSAARVHRPRQKADEVSIDILLGCLEHAKAWRNVLANARAVQDTTGAEQKILLADVEWWPTDFEIDSFPGARWRVPMIPKFEIPL